MPLGWSTFHVPAVHESWHRALVSTTQSTDSLVEGDPDGERVVERARRDREVVLSEERPAINDGRPLRDGGAWVIVILRCMPMPGRSIPAADALWNGRLTANGDANPSATMAELSGVALSTAQGWIAKTRTRGLLPPGRRGRAG